MYISSIKNLNYSLNFGISKQNPPAYDCSVAQDVFEKSAFQADVSEDDFELWAKNTGLCSKIGEIFVSENCLGSGHRNSVYKIPGSNRFVARINNSNSSLLGVLNYAKSHKKMSDWFIKDINNDFDENFGQQVGVVTAANDLNKTFQILLYKTGNPVGVPPEFVVADFKKSNPEYPNYNSREMKYKFAASMEQIAKLPQESYEKYINDLISIGKKGYCFDFQNSNNILIDEKEQTIGIVDICDNYIGPNNSSNDLGLGLLALTNYQYYNTFVKAGDDSVDSDTLVKTKKNILQIFSKYFSAMKKLGCKFSIDSSDFRRFISSDILAEYFGNEVSPDNYVSLKKERLF